MKTLATALGMAAILLAACGEPAKIAEPETEMVQPDEPQVKHNTDPHPDLIANADSMNYTYPRVSKNGFYLMNRASNTPVNILPVEAYEKLFSSLGTCSSNENKYMAIDRRKPALVDSISLSAKGENLVLNLPTASSDVMAFLERFKNEKVAFVINEHVLFMGSPNEVVDGKEIQLTCSSAEKETIQKMIDEPLKEREIN